MPYETMNDATLQFCQDGRDITGQFYCGQDATEVRAWTPGSTCLGAVIKTNAGTWHASASDVVDWVDVLTEAGYNSWEAALLASGSMFLPDRLYQEGNIH